MTETTPGKVSAVRMVVRFQFSPCMGRRRQPLGEAVLEAQEGDNYIATCLSATVSSMNGGGKGQIEPQHTLKCLYSRAEE